MKISFSFLDAIRPDILPFSSTVFSHLPLDLDHNTNARLLTNALTILTLHAKICVCLFDFRRETGVVIAINFEKLKGRVRTSDVMVRHMMQPWTFSCNAHHTLNRTIERRIL